MDKTAKSENRMGIIGLELYIPKLYVDMEELEQYDKVSKNKYTLGLGQLKMSIVEPLEDSASMALTVTNNLLIKHNIKSNQIGRLEVGSET